jgi:hypothetical protein
MTTKEKECVLYPSLKFAWKEVFPGNELFHVMKPGRVVVSPSKFGVSSTRRSVDVEPVFGSAEQFNEGLVEMCRIFGRRFALVLYSGEIPSVESFGSLCTCGTHVLSDKTIYTVEDMAYGKIGILTGERLLTDSGLDIVAVDSELSRLLTEAFEKRTYNHGGPSAVGTAILFSYLRDMYSALTLTGRIVFDPKADRALDLGCGLYVTVGDSNLRGSSGDWVLSVAHLHVNRSSDQVSLIIGDMTMPLGVSRSLSEALQYLHDEVKRIFS